LLCLVDPASDRDRLKGLREGGGVRKVWLSHWHEDHFMHLDLFEDVPLLMSELDAPQLSDVEIFLDGYGIKQEDQRNKIGDEYTLVVYNAVSQGSRFALIIFKCHWLSCPTIAMISSGAFTI